MQCSRQAVLCALRTAQCALAESSHTFSRTVARGGDASGSGRSFARSLSSAAEAKGSTAEGGSQRVSSRTETQERLFRKVLDGAEFKAAEAGQSGAAAAAASKTSVASRIFGIIQSLIFYPSLAAGVGFFASMYFITDEESKHMAKEAKASASDSPDDVVAGVKCWALTQFNDAREFYTRKKHEFTEPPSDFLLPDMDPDRARLGFRTLVLDVDGVLVQSHWDRQLGWRCYKRPGAADFLETLFMMYELVAFSNENHSYVDPILHRVDPGLTRGEPCVIYRLYKNSCQWEERGFMRDLTKLNRDMKKVIYIVSESRRHTVEPQENVLVIPDWKDRDPDDTTLLDIIPLLHLVARQDIRDVRAVCESYRGTDVVQEFKRRMSTQKQSAQAEKAKPRRSKGPFGGMFG